MYQPSGKSGYKRVSAQLTAQAAASADLRPSNPQVQKPRSRLQAAAAPSEVYARPYVTGRRDRQLAAGEAAANYEAFNGTPSDDSHRTSVSSCAPTGRPATARTAVHAVHSDPRGTSTKRPITSQPEGAGGRIKRARILRDDDDYDDYEEDYDASVEVKVLGPPPRAFESGAAAKSGTKRSLKGGDWHQVIAKAEQKLQTTSAPAHLPRPAARTVQRVVKRGAGYAVPFAASSFEGGVSVDDPESYEAAELMLALSGGLKASQ